MEDFSCEHLMTKEAFAFPLGGGWRGLDAIEVLKCTIEALNNARKRYLATKDKKYWWQMIQLLPSSYNQTRNVLLNYEVLANIYKSRNNHKLDEWRVHKTPEEHEFRNKDFSSGMWGFCDWIESLPYSELIVGGESKRYAEIGKLFSDGFQKGLGIDMESVEEAAKNYDPNDGVENHITLIKED